MQVRVDVGSLEEYWATRYWSSYTPKPYHLTGTRSDCRLINMLDCLLDLTKHKFCVGHLRLLSCPFCGRLTTSQREMPVFGILRDHTVLGIIVGGNLDFWRLIFNNSRMRFPSKSRKTLRTAVRLITTAPPDGPCTFLIRRRETSPSFRRSATLRKLAHN